MFWRTVCWGWWCFWTSCRKCSLGAFSWISILCQQDSFGWRPSHSSALDLRPWIVEQKPEVVIFAESFVCRRTILTSRLWWLTNGKTTACWIAAMARMSFALRQMEKLYWRVTVLMLMQVPWKHMEARGLEGNRQLDDHWQAYFSAQVMQRPFCGC